MQKYNDFYASVEKAVEEFKKWDRDKKIEVVSHLDADGITACAILTKALNRDNRKYDISIIKQLTIDEIKDFAERESKYFIFTDLGSGQIKHVIENLRDKNVLVLDHHQIVEGKKDNLIQINPHLFGIDGSKEIAGSGVVYLFAKKLNEKNKDLAHLAVIGAIGDVQEDGEFMKMNKEILEDAVEQDKIRIERGLRLFGRQTKPIHKILEYSTDPYIPGVSGSESGAIQFLHQIGIEPKNKSKWKRLVDLTDEEKKILTTGIIMKRFGEENPQDVLGNNYIICSEEKGSPTRDAREFATLLNACGRMDKASFGIGTCLGIDEDKRNAMKTLAAYKKEIVGAIKWYNENEDKLIKKDGFVIINAGDNISPTIIGTLASIISKGNDLKEGTYVLSLSRSDKNMTKISLRISGIRENKELDLRDVAKEIVKDIGGEAGGHQYAAGALIETDKEKEFLKAAERVLSERKI